MLVIVFDIYLCYFGPCLLINGVILVIIDVVFKTDSVSHARHGKSTFSLAWVMVYLLDLGFDSTTSLLSPLKMAYHMEYRQQKLP